MTKKIVIVGGGYVGTELAKGLEDVADVTLIEERSHFVHAPAMIRALVQPALIDQALIPYDKLLNRGTFLNKRAIALDDTGVTLADGTRVGADYIVVATGSEYAAPFKAKGADIDGLRTANANAHAQLQSAKSIAIIGAGAVGVELAGEIAHFMPGKELTLISAEASLFPGQPDKLGAQLAKKLKAANVDLVVGTRAFNLESTREPYAGTLQLSNGTEISADLIIPVIGSRAVSTLLDGLPGITHTSANRVKVDGWMRPSSHPNLFAAGDIADTGDGMTIVAISRQIPWLKKTISELINGNQLETLKPYSQWDKAPIIVPLGPKRGNSFLGLFTAGNLLTSMIKGSHLFLGKYRKALGQA